VVDTNNMDMCVKNLKQSRPIRRNGHSFLMNWPNTQPLQYGIASAADFGAPVKLNMHGEQ